MTPERKKTAAFTHPPGSFGQEMSDPKAMKLGHSLVVVMSLSFIVATACSSREALPAPTCVVELGSSPQRGPSDAWVTIVEFADFQCVFCRDVEATIARVDRERPGLRWVFKHFPLTSIHPRALDAALAAECAGEQNRFWEMHEQLLANQHALDPVSLSKYAEGIGLDLETYHVCVVSDAALRRTAADFSLGIDNGVEGTPAFFVNGQLIPGAVAEEDFIAVIDQVREIAIQSGVSPAQYYASIESQGCK